MAKKYNTRLIKANYSYTVEQVADLLTVDVGTVRRWINKEGLKRIPNVRPHLIHSSDLKAFLEVKQRKEKKPCASHEVFCMTCRVPRVPRADSAVVETLPNHSIRYKAACGVCDGKINRTIRMAEWNEKHPLAAYLNEAANAHDGTHLMHLTCPLQKEKIYA
jgi:excisionase family DNA binding protein